MTGVAGECWEWKGTRNVRGYGQKRFGHKAFIAHRLAWAWANWNGEGDWKHVPDGMVICHRCDNPPCVNPAHLFLGTQLDNVMDMMTKGRHVPTPRQTHCKNGHPRTDENLYVWKKGRGVARRCKVCDRARTARRWAAKRSSEVAA